MKAMASQITDVSIVYSAICSGVDQRKLQSSASLAFVCVCVLFNIVGGLYNMTLQNICCMQTTHMKHIGITCIMKSFICPNAEYDIQSLFLSWCHVKLIERNLLFILSVKKKGVMECL